MHKELLSKGIQYSKVLAQDASIQVSLASTPKRYKRTKSLPILHGDMYVVRNFSKARSAHKLREDGYDTTKSTETFDYLEEVKYRLDDLRLEEQIS